MKTVLALFVWMHSGTVVAGEFQLVFRHGTPATNRQAAWDGRIEWASWVDDDHIVFQVGNRIRCLSVTSGKPLWSIRVDVSIDDWSVSRQTKRLAYLGKKAILGGSDVHVVDCLTGKSLCDLDSKKLAQLLSQDFVLPTRVAIAPDGRLLVCMFAQKYERTGYILDPSYQKLLSTFPVDAFIKEFSLSPDGKRIAVIAEKDVLCVRDLTVERDVFFQGKRLRRKQNLTVTIDAPFISDLRDGGAETVVYTEDNSWDTGKVFVYNLKTKKSHSFDARNGHIEMDVSFNRQRIVLTGTSTDLTLLNFQGRVLAHSKAASSMRNLCVEFSPDGQRVLVGSWDTTLSVFKIVEPTK